VGQQLLAAGRTSWAASAPPAAHAELLRLTRLPARRRSRAATMRASTIEGSSM
jgi:hypothetical protein